MDFQNNGIRDKNNLHEMTSAKLNEEKQKMSQTQLQVQAQAYGDKSADVRLDELTTNDRWVAMYKKLLHHDDEYKNIVKDYLNNFYLQENADSKPDEVTFGNDFFLKTPFRCVMDSRKWTSSDSLTSWKTLS